MLATHERLALLAWLGFQADEEGNRKRGWIKVG
jgi:hypothetical protein